MKAVNLVKVVGHVKVATPVFNRLKGHLYFLQVVFVSLWIKCSWSGIQSKQRLTNMPFDCVRFTKICEMAYPPTILIASASCLTTSTVIPEIASSSQRRRSGSISSTALDGASSLAVTYKPEDIEFVCLEKATCYQLTTELLP